MEGLDAGTRIRMEGEYSPLAMGYVLLAGGLSSSQISGAGRGKCQDRLEVGVVLATSVGVPLR